MSWYCLHNLRSCASSLLDQMRSPHPSNYQTAIAYSQKIKIKRSPHHSFHKTAISYSQKIKIKRSLQSNNSGIQSQEELYQFVA
ncbi:hypothetical protein [Pseudanabaena sp. UWO310]|uniref:hypothetical protein n=1 Tax=Pseudanabaena sp. UWO310 TaxID=2480795 RepID=UPI00115B0217|nr:hypothetical protein [Pseudanabaena sp. UWO310]TYQ25662.1 hypothetical protein PseudUWO310_18730 [Pseudanabaena sp. UWO310]